MKYAAQRKRDRDIEKAIKREKSAQKSNDKKRKMRKIYYYARLKNKNK